MTKLGSILFWTLGLLFLGGIALMVRLALRGTGNVRDALREGGWAVSDGQSPVRWTAQRARNGVTTSIEQPQAGVKLTVWTEVRVPIDAQGAEVLVTKKVPSLLSADGVLASFLGQRTPPKWDAGTPAFRECCDTWATDQQAAARWLTPRAQELLQGGMNLPQLVGVHFGEGSITARIAGDLDDPKLLEEVVSLVERLQESP
jgi:hypothetical protein